MINYRIITYYSYPVIIWKMYSLQHVTCNIQVRSTFTTDYVKSIRITNIWNHFRL